MEQKLSFLKNMKKTDKYLILLGVGILVVVLSCGMPQHLDLI